MAADDRPRGFARYHAADQAPTASQHRTLAELAAAWCGLGPIDTALQATVAAARLRLALERDGDAPAPLTVADDVAAAASRTLTGPDF